MSRSSERVGAATAGAVLAALLGASAAWAQPPAPPAPAPPAPAAPAATPPPRCGEGTVNEECDPRPPPGADLVPDLAVLKTPASPAAMVLGVVDGQIQRPTTPSGAAFSLAAGIGGLGKQDPLENFALEVTPYWLFDHPRLTAGDIERSRPATFFRNASISLATATREQEAAEGEEATTHRQLAIGLRTTFWPGRPSKAALVCQRYFDEDSRAAVEDLADSSVAYNREWQEENPRPVNPLGREKPSDPALAAAWEKAQRETEVLLTLWATRKEVAKAEWKQRSQPTGDDPVFTACLDTIQQRTGLLVDGAAAYSVDVPDGDASRLDEDGLRAATGWLTVAYVLEAWVTEERRRAYELSLLATGRVQEEWAAMASDTFRLDGGGRVVLAWERYGVSLEGVYRRQSSGDVDENLWRAALSIDYRLTGGTWVSATFGKDFGATADEEPILALANLQWNIGRDRGARVDGAADTGDDVP